MKVYILIWNFKIGGIQKHAVLLANYFVGLEKEVCILYSSKDGDLKELLDHRVELTQLNIPNTNHPKKLLILYRQLKAMIPKNAFVLANGPNNFRQLARINLLAKRWNLLYILQNDLHVKDQKGNYWKKTEVRWISNAGKTKIVALSRAQRQAHEKELGIRNIEVIPNFIDFTHNYLTSYKRSRPKGLSLGRYAHQKGYDMLLEAIRYVDAEVEIDVYGFGEEERQALIRSAEEQGLNQIDFLPSVTEVNEVLSKYDYFILSSRYEPFGIVLIEALACGLPVVTTDCDGPSEIINKTNGIIVQKEDPKDLARGINKMHKALQDGLYNPTKIRATAAQYSVEKVAQRYLKVVNG